MLGAGNAATPAGLRAMAHMQTLNPHKHVATNEMCMLMALSTAVITLIPASTIRLLDAAQSTRATAVVLPALLTTIFASMVAVMACKLLQRFTVYQPQPGDEAEARAAEAMATQVGLEEESEAEGRLAVWQQIVLALFLILPLTLCILYVVSDRKSVV